MRFSCSQIGPKPRMETTVWNEPINNLLILQDPGISLNHYSFLLKIITFSLTLCLSFFYMPSSDLRNAHTHYLTPILTSTKNQRSLDRVPSCLHHFAPAPHVDMCPAYRRLLLTQEKWEWQHEQEVSKINNVNLPDVTCCFIPAHQPLFLQWVTPVIHNVDLSLIQWL